MLLAICENRPADLEEIYHFLDQPDALFNDIYQEREVRDSVFFYTYPFIHGAAIPDNIEEVIAPIGTQTSKYHHENLRDHVALVAANLVDAGLSSTLAVQLAVLHDVGKKYTAATNKVGDICYYNQEAVSALIAKYWLRRACLRSSAFICFLAPIIYFFSKGYNLLFPITRMTSKASCGAKLSELMSNHILSNVNRDKFISVMNCNSVSHKFRGNH